MGGPPFREGIKCQVHPTRGPTRFNSTAKGARSFCSRCGTPLTSEHADFPEEIDVTTGSLDDPELVLRRYNTHTSTRLRWVAATARMRGNSQQA